MAPPSPDRPDPFGGLTARVPASAAEVEHAVETILGELSAEDRRTMMSGDLDFWPGLVEMLHGGYGHKPYVGGEVARVGLPGVRFSDGPRGVTVGASTCFPVSMARGATWDPPLEARVGAAMGAEARAQGANLLGSVCINLLYHPAWGRAQETYGEDPVHVGEMGVAAVRGVQRHVMACVKHFALNNMENARFQVDVTARPRVLHEVYLPHFRRCVEAGAACVMSAYNSINGEWCGHNHQLLTEILKERWGFDGFVITDWIYGIRDAEPAANAGVDLEMPFRMHFAPHLAALVESGRVGAGRVDDAARRIIRAMLRAAGSTDTAAIDVVASPGHRALAREVAQQSMVVIRNEPIDGVPVLPLAGGTLGRVAVLGLLADLVNTGDAASSDVRPPEVVTPLAGLRAALECEIVADDGTDPGRAASVAADADAAVVVVGYTSADEGEYIDMSKNPELFGLFPPLAPDDPIASELADIIRNDRPAPRGGDRGSLALHPSDEELLLAVGAAQPRTVAVLVTGSAVITERWRDATGAIVVAWYAGMEGGHALADLLLGRVNPSGRLPCAFPVSAGDLAPFDRDARHVEYGLFHGQRYLDRMSRSAAFPLGWGLSYTSFEYGDPVATVDTDSLDIQVDVSNVGSRGGAEVVQCYAEAPDSSVERPSRWLVGFAKVPVAAGETVRTKIRVPFGRLAYWDEAADDFVVEAIRYDLVVAPDAAASGRRTSVVLATD